ncbi:hypothetical protein [Salinibacterium sp. ZJ77]|uniref:hypothetical protein n=1 Tax=Salinibacterium sp. ZJ77 TaxID=2708337 RepID=UPI00141F3BCA|nr:hypothetical protein [Salinibacterium sp. ZJ77]
MRKFLFNGSVISSLFGAVGVIKATQHGPRDWRLALMWIAWGCSVAIAVGTVAKESKRDELEW